MPQYQSGIMQPIPELARYLFFSLKTTPKLEQTLKALAQMADGETIVVGLGLSCIQQLDIELAGLRAFPALVESAIEIPSTPAALCCWLRGDDRGELMHQSRRLTKLLEPAFEIQTAVDAFQYGASQDLTGYEDGTENPIGDDALEAGFVKNKGLGLDGSSFFAIQQWVHDLDYFESLSTQAQDHTFGRQISDNEEIDDAPLSAHVKRTAQEDFEPEAFVLRRSMPWANENQMGLVFTAFGHSFDAFEALLNRMIGKDDGVVDALFSFTRPVSGSYFWCPPANENGLDLSALNL
jgi:putative iron-dependent peroxidase